MDFYAVSSKEDKHGKITLSPDFLVGRSKDLMVRARSFYAIWDEEAGLWSTDEYDVGRLVDAEMRRYAEEKFPGQDVAIKRLQSYDSNTWTKFKMFVSNLSDNYHQLDDNLTFANQTVKRADYVSKKLPYPLAPGDYSAWDELVGTLYSVDERAKIEWAIGALVAGDAKHIQKFIVFYGLAGTGKSTIINIIERLFEGYTATFEAKALGSNNNAFATEAFKDNPLVAIQHDGDLSKIEDNTKLNSIIAHEKMMMNEKYKPGYTSTVKAFLFMGTNQPVKISDAKSGIIRRLIDVHPTGALIPTNHYHTLMSQMDFQLGAIAQHCLEVYRSMGKNFYNKYAPTEMMLQTDVFFNFIEAHYDIFKLQNGTSLKQAYSLYKEFCADTGIERPLPQYKFREELRNYFDDFKDRMEVEGQTVRSYYSGFTASKFKAPVKDERAFSLVIEETKSLFDDRFATAFAQYSSAAGTPKASWTNVSSMLKELDTSQEHYVLVPENHIVIDFDLKGEDGSKSLERNLEAASAWPATYAELSKSGAGVHLHYDYDGDTDELASLYSEGIEVKVYRGKAALRRKLSKCNAVPVATINSGLPLKEKKGTSVEKIQSEKGLRDLIERNLKREIMPGTKPSIDFIKKILDDVYADGLSYDVTDLRPRLISFANNSTNQNLLCLKLVQQMKFVGQGANGEPVEVTTPMPVLGKKENDGQLAFFDVEVFPNLVVVCWKYKDVDQVVRLINPTAQQAEDLLKLNLIGFNNRRYDNHIIYGLFMGYDNEQIYQLSQRMVNNKPGAHFAAAYDLSYTDIWDFSSKKQTLKKFEIELGLPHVEMDLPWDQPVPEELWPKVTEYCVNDVLATEATFNAREQDFVARQILADLSGLTVNDPTPKHTARIVFGNDRDAQRHFVYTDLSKDFPGYEFDMGKSRYKDEDPGEGGYVYAEKGMYSNVGLLDVASMHPTSITQLNMFGPYTPNFTALVDARVAIKRGQYDEARAMLGGKLAPYLKEEAAAKDLAYALKIVINIVYGLTSAKFDNPFRDKRNKDNIVAKRGALFMIDLKRAVQRKGYTVVHIKTDSIKIADVDNEIIEFVSKYGEKYGYTFEHEATYDMLCLVNDAVYIARQGSQENAKWTAVGAQFQHPYVFKTLFSGEEITPDDLAETKQVMKGALYLQFAEGEPHFVGKTGRFVPVKEDSEFGGVLQRIVKDEETGETKAYAATGTKGYKWVEAEVAKSRQLEVDMNYFEKLVEDAQNTIDSFGPLEVFVNG